MGDVFSTIIQNFQTHCCHAHQIAERPESEQPVQDCRTCPPQTPSREAKNRPLSDHPAVPMPDRSSRGSCSANRFESHERLTGWSFDDAHRAGPRMSVKIWNR